MPGALFPVILIVLAVAAAWPLSAWLQRVYEGRLGIAGRVLGPVERVTYRALRTHPEREQGWGAYARCVLLFSAVSFLLLYLLQRLQGRLPLNPDDLFIHHTAAPKPLTTPTERRPQIASTGHWLP